MEALQRDVLEVVTVRKQQKLKFTKQCGAEFNFRVFSIHYIHYIHYSYSVYSAHGLLTLSQLSYRDIYRLPRTGLCK